MSCGAMMVPATVCCNVTWKAWKLAVGFSIEMHVKTNHKLYAFVSYLWKFTVCFKEKQAIPRMSVEMKNTLTTFIWDLWLD